MSAEVVEGSGVPKLSSEFFSGLSSKWELDTYGAPTGSHFLL